MNMSRTDCGFHLHGRQELTEATPHLLGYHPTDSLVVFGLGAPDWSTGGSDIEMMVRIDLADACTPDALEYLMSAAASADTEQLVVLVYGPSAGPLPPRWRAEVGLLPHDELIEEVQAVAADKGIRVVAAMYVCGMRWWCYQPCGETRCCPADGSPVAGSDAALKVAYAGLAALPDRAALEETFRPFASPQQEGMEAALVAAQQELLDAGRARDLNRWRAGTLVHLRAVFDRLSSTAEVPWLADRVAGRLLVGLTDESIRDAAWMWLEKDAGGRWRNADQLWRQLARRSPEQYRVPPLFLGAWACWRGGDGIHARAGLERALAIDPSYQGALLLLSAMFRWPNPKGLPSLARRSRRPGRAGSTKAPDECEPLVASAAPARARTATAG
jgi:Domain of unknown function (DUF4192)